MKLVNDILKVSVLSNISDKCTQGRDDKIEIQSANKQVRFDKVASQHCIQI